MKESYLPLSESMIEVVARRFRMLGEPQRLRLLQVLESGERAVGEIVEALGANQSNISKHLHALHDAGLVSRHRDGNCILYAISDPVIFDLCALVCRSAKENAHAKLAEMAAPASRRRSARRNRS